MYIYKCHSLAAIPSCSLAAVQYIIAVLLLCATILLLLYTRRASSCINRIRRECVSAQLDFPYI